MSDYSIKTWAGGYRYKNTFGTYLHTHFASDYNLIYKFCSALEEYSESNL